MISYQMDGFRCTQVQISLPSYKNDAKTVGNRVQFPAVIAKKKPAEPKWWKNTFFGISVLLLCVGVAGLPFLGGENLIRDPGQQQESGLSLIYFVAAVVMFVNGWISHRHAVQEYQDHAEAGE